MSPYGDRALDVEVAEALEWKWYFFESESDTVGFDRVHKPFISRDGSWEGRKARIAKKQPRRGALLGHWDRLLPRYRTDPVAYMGLLEEMSCRGFDFTISGGEPPFMASVWRRKVKMRLFDSTAPTLGEAICRAVIAALTT